MTETSSGGGRKQSTRDTCTTYRPRYTDTSPNANIQRRLEDSHMGGSNKVCHSPDRGWYKLKHRIFVFVNQLT